MIITDLGGVLVDFDGRAMIQNFGKLCRASPEEVESFFNGESRDTFEIGRMSPQEFCEKAKAEIGFGGTQDAFEREFSNPTHFNFNREVFDLYFLNLKPRNSVEFWMLSNINILHAEYIFKRWPGISANCRRVYLSCELGLRKPDRAIYKKVLELGGRSCNRYIFIDDLEENVEAARDCGIGAARFESEEKLWRVLADRGFVLSA